MADPRQDDGMRQFALRQILESIGWLSLGLAVFRTFVWANRSAYTDDYYWEWADAIIWTTWIITGVAFGNAVAAFAGRRIVWSILGICWTCFLVLAVFGLGTIPRPF